MSERKIGKCAMCGSEFDKSVNNGREYGIVRLNGSGNLFGEADLCPLCLDMFLKNQQVFRLDDETQR